MKSYSQFWDGVIRSRSAEELDEQVKDVGDFRFRKFREDFPPANGWEVFTKSNRPVGIIRNPRGSGQPSKLFIYDRSYVPPRSGAGVGSSRGARGKAPAHVANIIQSKAKNSVRGSKPVIAYDRPGDGMLQAVVAWLNSNKSAWSHRA